MIRVKPNENIENNAGQIIPANTICKILNIKEHQNKTLVDLQCGNIEINNVPDKLLTILKGSRI